MPVFRIISTLAAHHYLFVLLMATSSTIRADINVDEKFVYYDVYGNTAVEIRQSINQHTRQYSNRFDALTTWKVTWHFGFIPRQKKCKITEVTIDATIAYRLPKWSQSETHSDETLADTWRRYSEALHAHELHHGVLVKDATLEIEQSILSADDTAFAPPNCHQLDKLANEKAKAVVARMKKQHQRFDKLTAHGRKTGAVLP